MSEGYHPWVRMTPRPPRLPWTVLTVVWMVCACRPSVADVPAPEQPWEEMTFEQRKAHMSARVLPHMRATFQSHDAERFASFDCTTCHASGAAAGDYAMPDPALPHLVRKNFRTEIQAKHPEMVRFMWERVEPEMARLVGTKAGRTRFNCRDCHVRD